MKYKVFTCNPFQENAYLLWDETNNAILVDPGMSNDLELKELTEFITNNNLLLNKIVNTHCHVDHVFGVQQVIDLYKVPFLARSEELPNVKRFMQHASIFGVKPKFDCPEPTEFLDDEKQVHFGNTVLDLLFVPGHSPGHIALYNQKDGLLVGGDVLFDGSIGRTDLPGGDFNTLEKSIKNEFYKLPDSTVVLAGHMNSTTIGKEKSTNPMVRA